jgi:hypothetical protein
MPVDNDFFAAVPDVSTPVGLSPTIITAEGPRPRMCVPRLLPSDLQEKAEAIAVEVNPENRPRMMVGPSKAVMVVGRAFPQHKVIRARFFRGDPTVITRIKRWMEVFHQYTNLRIEWVTSGKTDIRIDANYNPDDGSWSYYPMDAAALGQDEVTMRFGWLRPRDADEEYSSVVLHEGGHGIMAWAHEHESPAAAGIRWNKPYIYADLAKPPNKWDKATVDANFFDLLTESQTRHTKLDKKSVMFYAISRLYTLDGFEVGWNTMLSPMDIQFAMETYPKLVVPVPKPPTPTPTPPTPTTPAQPTTQGSLLHVGARPVLHQIRTPGTRDVYRFEIPRDKAGSYTVSAVRITGASTYSVELHGLRYPHTNPVVRSGSVTYRFDAGVQYLAVRASDNRSTGQYSISVRSAGGR